MSRGRRKRLVMDVTEAMLAEQLYDDMTREQDPTGDPPNRTKDWKPGAQDFWRELRYAAGYKQEPM